MHVPMVLSVEITNFKFRQYQLRAISSNLMLTKVPVSKTGEAGDEPTCT